MTEFKVNIADPKTGKCKQIEVKDNNAIVFLGKKIGDKIKGDDIGFSGYEFEITGGSDYCGFPMRKDVEGVGRKRILAVSGVGIRKKGKGVRQRKTVAGNTIHERIAQINVKIVKYGKEALFEEKKETAEQEAEKKEEKSEKEVEEKKEKEEGKDKGAEKEEKEEKVKEKVKEEKEEKKEEESN